MFVNPGTEDGSGINLQASIRIVFAYFAVYTEIMDKQFSIRLRISRVENGQFLAESDDIPGLVAQGRTIPETVEIAQDVARKLIESYIDHGDPLPKTLRPISGKIELEVAVGI